MAKLPRKPKIPEASSKEPTYTDSLGVVYIGDQATLRVSSDAKLSRNYNSIGASVGIEFQTPVAGLDGTIEKAFKKVRSALKHEMNIISDALDTL